MSKSVLMVVAHHNFRDEEYASAREQLEAAGATITVASTLKQGVSGSQGMTIDADLLIDDVVPEDYDAVVFIGGTGASQYWHDVKAHEIALAALKRDKVIAASSHAPVTLAVAGILTGRKTTGHVAIYEKLKVAGANFTGSKLEQDGKIITSSGANSAREFGRAVAQAIG